MLNHIKIVLVNPSHPGNIGATARAMKNMCLSELVLVAPLSFPHADATARASGADDVLANATVFATLQEALQDSVLVFGASARFRRLAWPSLTAQECAEMVLREPGEQSIAILFGREHSGLTNEELDLCHYLLNIPSNPQYSSLNIAAAVQIVCYEIHRQWLEHKNIQNVSYKTPSLPIGDSDDELAKTESSIDGVPLATGNDMQGFYDQLECVLADIGFLQTDHPRKMMRRLKRLFNRARLDQTELNILRGIFKTIQQYSKSD